MKYKTLSFAALMMGILTVDANAGNCSTCDNWFNGSQSCLTKFPSKLDPSYWTCRTLFGTINVLCSGIICGAKSEGLAQKALQNEKVCSNPDSKTYDEAKCQATLETDVADGYKDVAEKLQNIETNVEDDLKKEADAYAECLKTNPPEVCNKQ